MYKNVESATIIDYATALGWVLEPLVSHEMSWTLIKEKIQEIDMRFIPIRAFNNPIRLECLTWTVRLALTARKNSIVTAHAFLRPMLSVSWRVGVKPTHSGTGEEPCSSGKFQLS